MNKLTVFFAIFAVLAVSVSARLHFEKEDEELQPIATTVRKGESSSSEEGLDLTKLSDSEREELRAWANTVDLTWNQIEALSQFQQDIKSDKTGERKKEHINKVCKAFDQKPEENADGKTKEQLALAQTIQLLSLYQQLLTVKEDRQVFVILKDMCHLVNNIQALAPPKA